MYRNGFSPRKRFAFTAGNTITNAGDVERPRRRSLVERHEGLHVWQQRWFGPIFPLVYGTWMIGGALTGVGRLAASPRSAVGGRRRTARVLLQPVRAVGLRSRPQLAAAPHDPTAAAAPNRQVSASDSRIARRPTPERASRSRDAYRERAQPAQDDAPVPLGRVGRELHARGSVGRGVLIASVPSSRARCAPRHEWTPPPNDMCWLASARRRSSVSAVSPHFARIAVRRAEAGHQEACRPRSCGRRSRSRRA